MKNLRGLTNIHLNADTIKAIFSAWYAEGTYHMKGEKNEVVDVTYVVESNTIIVSVQTTFELEEPKV